MEWEKINETGLVRMKVPGGWLVKQMQFFNVKMVEPGMIGKTKEMPLNGGIAMAFVPDPLHTWKIETQEVISGPENN